MLSSEKRIIVEQPFAKRFGGAVGFNELVNVLFNPLEALTPRSGQTLHVPRGSTLQYEIPLEP